jgi:hypothetical protein
VASVEPGHLRVDRICAMPGHPRGSASGIYFKVAVIVVVY